MFSALMPGVAVRGPSAEKKGQSSSDALRDAFQTVGELTPEAGSPHDAPMSSKAPPSPARGGSWVLTIRQFISVMKSCSQREKGWPDGWLAVQRLALKVGVGVKVRGEGVGGSREASDVILLEVVPFVASWYEEKTLEWSRSWIETFQVRTWNISMI